MFLFSLSLPRTEISERDGRNGEKDMAVCVRRDNVVAVKQAYCTENSQDATEGDCGDPASRSVGPFGCC